MLRWAVLLAAMTVAWGSAAGSAAPRQKWAVLVGVDRYLRTDVTPLQYAVADAKAVAKTLVARAGFPAENVFLLTTDQSGDNAPTRGNLAFRLGWLAEHAKPGDSVVFYFSGHGMRMEPDATHTEPVSYLLTCDADPRNAQTLKLTGFSHTELQDLLKSLRARELIVFLDACRNDPRGGKGGGGDNKLTDQMSRDLVIHGRPASAAGPPVSATIFACSPGERSYEWSDAGHGFFSQFLIQGLSGKAADRSGKVTLASLETYLKTEVPRASERVMGFRQVPWMLFEGPDRDACVLAAGGKPGKVTEADIDTRPQPQHHPGSSGLDPELVGTWRINYHNFLLLWHIHADGSWVQQWVGAPPQEYRGTMKAGSGIWSLVRSDGFSGGGSYAMQDHNAVMMDGILGKGVWTRASETP